MLRSNLYQALPQVYGHEGVFGTGCMLVQEDTEDLFRCYVQPVGSYSIGLDSRLLVNTFAREFRWTVRQVVERFVRGDDPSVPGTGLGLALVREHVRLHEGTVVIKRSPAGGARFVVTIPKAMPYVST